MAAAAQPLRRPEDYPAQEPMSGPGAAYNAECLRRSAGIPGIDVAYGDDPYQGIALFLPKRPNGTVFAFVHGGGWTNGYREWMAFMAPPFVEAGVTFASIGYRLAPKHVFPTGFEDTARGVAWLWRNIKAHGGDPKRLYIGGHSAGGHYTALLAVRRDWQAGLGVPTDAVRGCLPISGVYDLTETGGLSMRPRFLGAPGREREASPIYSIAGTPPPFFMAHGSKDFPHLVRQAEAMEAALKRAGTEVERLVLDDRDHFTASYAGGEAAGPWVPRALAWLEAHS
ncbi:MAG TPA: alpha/beta hydrolase [Alphaproteobacteria bacterium]|jgi:acetyl esterase/lipase|nr:alpha/beta hydrolase [Alphaproteobacteria bacterium]